MKETSLYAKLLADTSADAELIDAWLDERENDEDQAAVELPAELSGVTCDADRLAASSNGYHPEIAPGQLRILSKRFINERGQIPYVLVLERWEDDMWLVAPFSPYTFPATPGEMVTHMRHRGLRVVQAWNARTVHDVLLKKSFLAGEATENVRAAALALFRNQIAGCDLPSDFPFLCGPAVKQDADPRRDYLQESIDFLKPLSAAVRAVERFVLQIAAITRPDFGLGNVALAAGAQERQRTETFHLDGAELSLTFSPDDGHAIFTFFGEDDEPDASRDGTALLGTDGEFLGVFRAGTIRVEAAKVKEGFLIADREGTPVPLRKES